MSYMPFYRSLPQPGLGGNMRLLSESNNPTNHVFHHRSRRAAQRPAGAGAGPGVAHPAGAGARPAGGAGAAKKNS